MLEQEIIELQNNIKNIQESLKLMYAKRNNLILQMHRSGYSPRQIGKKIGINHSHIYKVLERNGYQPKYSYRESHLRNLTQKAIIESLRSQV